MPVESLKSFVSSLLSQVPEDEASPRVIVVKPPVHAPTPVRPNGQKPESTQPAYDPALVCLLEVATTLATRDSETVSALGKEIADTLQSAIRDSERLHPIAVSRASYYLLKLLKASDVSSRDIIQLHVSFLTLSRTSNTCAHLWLYTPSHLLEGICSKKVPNPYSRVFLNASQVPQHYARR